MPRKTAPLSSRVPTGSRRDQVPRDSGTAKASSGTATRATGTLSQKIACQLTPSTTAPPTTGPSATPRPETPPQIPIAMARFAAGTDAASRVSESGIMAAAPSPCTARATMRDSELVDSAAAIEAAPKTRSPAIIVRRRPHRSPTVAAVSMTAAKVSV